jgi:acyl dehydratase
MRRATKPRAARRTDAILILSTMETEVAKTVINGNADLKNYVGREIAGDEWLTVTQQMIDQFAAATGDHQWIHVDVERARRESPYKTTVAHGYLTLSLLPALRSAAFELPQPRMAINYGLNKVRFTGPVPSGARLRATHKLAKLDELPDNGVQMQWESTVYREGSDKPVLVAETVTRRFE